MLDLTARALGAEAEIGEGGHTKLFAHFTDANGRFGELPGETTAVLLKFLVEVVVMVKSIVGHGLFIVRKRDDLAVIELAITTLSVGLIRAARRARRAAP